MKKKKEDLNWYERSNQPPTTTKMMIHSERSIKCNKVVRCAWKHHRKVKQLNSLEYRVNKAKAKAKKTWNVSFVCCWSSRMCVIHSTYCCCCRLFSTWNQSKMNIMILKKAFERQQTTWLGFWLFFSLQVEKKFISLQRTNEIESVNIWLKLLFAFKHEKQIWATHTSLVEMFWHKMFIAEIWLNWMLILLWWRAQLKFEIDICKKSKMFLFSRWKTIIISNRIYWKQKRFLRNERIHFEIFNWLQHSISYYHFFFFGIKDQMWSKNKLFPSVFNNS